MLRLSLTSREALYVLWALEEAFLISEPEEEETLSLLISKLSDAAAPFSSARQARSRFISL